MSTDANFDDYTTISEDNLIDHAIEAGFVWLKPLLQKVAEGAYQDGKDAAEENDRYDEGYEDGLEAGRSEGA